MRSIAMHAAQRPRIWVLSVLLLASLPVGSCGGGGGGSGSPCGAELADLSGTWTGEHAITASDGSSVQGTEATSFLEKVGGADVKGFWTYVRGDAATTLFLDGSCSGRQQELRTCSMRLGVPPSDVLSLDSTDGCRIIGSGTTISGASVINVTLSKQSQPPECPNDVNMELDGVWVGSHEFTNGSTGREFVQFDDASCDQITGVWVFERNGQLVQNNFTGRCSAGRGSYVLQVGNDTLALTLVPDQCVLTGTGTHTETGETYTLRMARGNRTIS